MTAFVVQLLLCLAAGAGLYFLWRRVVRGASPLVFWLITAGFLVRAIGGEIGFWISYLNLPVARSLQIGRGLWVFALDAIGYFDRAATTASAGVPAIIHLDKTLGSAFYVQVLATSILAFGAVTSVALLVNLAAYLGTCAVVRSFRDLSGEKPVAVSIALISFSPACIVWSVQPLKDTSFLFLVAAMFGALRLWQQTFESDRLLRFVPLLLVMASLLYGISGIRWYFGFSIFAAAAILSPMVIVRSRSRVVTSLAAVALIVVLGASFLAGSGPYAPTPLRNAMLFKWKAKPNESPAQLVSTLDESRRAFDSSSGATMIGAGKVLQEIDTKAGAKGQVVVATRVADDVYRRPGAKLPVTAAIPAEEETEAVAKPPVSGASTKVASKAAATPPPAPTVVVPGSRAGRIIAGTAALALPHAIAERIGLVHVGGGRGMWLLIEMDTLVFDIALVFAIVGFVGALRRRALNSPVFWIIGIVTAMIAGALAYTVSNFGTLFRLRDMVFLGLTLLPLAAAAGSRQTAEEPDAAHAHRRTEGAMSAASPSADITG